MGMFSSMNDCVHRSVVREIININTPFMYVVNLPNLTLCLSSLGTFLEQLVH